MITKGFCIEFVKTQIEGLTGHIEEAGFPFDRVEWGKPDYIEDNGGNPGWWVYEQTAYWLDGFTRAAIVLKNDTLLKRAATIIYNVINGADESGYLGPKFLKTAGDWDRWPHVVFFRACMALYEYNHDETILRALEKHYVGDSAEYSCGRNVLNVEILLWLYSKTGKEVLLKLAEDYYQKYNEICKDDLCDSVALSDMKPYAHGVSYNEYSKLGAILYIYTQKQEYLAASIAAYEKIDKYFLLIDGCHCSDEFLINNDIMRSHETCCISDYTWSLNYLFEATGNVEYLDKIEKCVFNAGLGAVTDDFRALQYFSCVNQVIADYRSNHNDFFKGSKWMSYRPNPGTECCPGNVNRFMPNYILNSWKKSGNDIFLKLYSSGVFEADGIKIEEHTDYPFEDTISLLVSAEKPYRLHFRLPKENEGYTIKKNGEIVDTVKENGFTVVEVCGDCNMEIAFAFSVRKHIEDRCIWFSRGAVVYANAIKTRKEIDEAELRQSEAFPAYNCYAAEKWNFGLKENCAAKVDSEGSLTVTGFEIEGWDLVQTKKLTRCINLYDKVSVELEGDFVLSPALPDKATAGAEKIIKLVPYGFAKLRVTAFPKILEE